MGQPMGSRNAFAKPAVANGKRVAGTEPSTLAAGKKRKAGGLNDHDFKSEVKTDHPRKRARPNFSLPNAEFVVIRVGPESKEFRIHYHVLTFYSKWFKDTLDGRKPTPDGKEDRALVLNRVDPRVFGLFVNWIYSLKLEHACDGVTGGKQKLEILELANLWTRAGKWCVPELQNRVIKLPAPMILEANNDCSKDGAIWAFFQYAYQCASFTPLKRLAVDKMVTMASALVPLSEWANDFPAGLLADLTEALLRQIATLNELRRSNFNLYYVEDNEPAVVAKDN